MCRNAEVFIDRQVQKASPALQDLNDALPDEMLGLGTLNFVSFIDGLAFGDSATLDAQQI